MTDPGQHGRGVVTRWRMLAERRLNYLVELQETGRWTLYYSEPDFRNVLDEARVAVKTWEQLSSPDPVQDKVIEVSMAQAADTAIPESPDIGSANGVETEHDLRKI